MMRAFVLKPVMFYGITFSLALLVTLSVGWLGESVLILTMTTPLISALIMLFWIAPESRPRDIPALLGLNSVGLKGWPLAFAAPSGIHLSGMIALSLLGLAVFVGPVGGLSIDFTFDLLMGFLIGCLLALFEEAGWRGYLLPRVSAGRGAVQAMLIVGFLHGLWHMPLILGTPFYHSEGNLLIILPFFMITLTLVGVFYGFLRVWTGSVWPVAIAHGAANAAWEVFEQTNTTKTPLVMEVLGGESGLIVICGLLIVCGLCVMVLHRPGFTARMVPVG